jgi:hypothetical protein
MLGVKVVRGADMQDVGLALPKHTVEIAESTALAERHRRGKCPAANADQLTTEFMDDAGMNSSDAARANDRSAHASPAPSRPLPAANLDEVFVRINGKMRYL